MDVLLHSLWQPGNVASDGSWGRLGEDLAKTALACVAADRPVLPRWEITPEWSWPASTGPGARAAHIHRVALLLAEHGVARWMTPDPPASATTPRQRCAVEVAATAMMTKRLGTARFMGRQVIGSGVLAMRFIGPAGAFAALVCPALGVGTRPVPVVIPLGVRAENLFGRVLADGEWPTEVSLSLAPVYIWPTTDQDDWLDGVLVAPGSREDRLGLQKAGR